MKPGMFWSIGITRRFPTAEAIRRHVQLVGLIHVLGKLMFLAANAGLTKPRKGGTWVVGPA